MFTFSALGKAQLPSEAEITNDGRLTYGQNPVTGFYAVQDVHKIEILLEEPNWFQLLEGTSGPGGVPGQVLVGRVVLNDTLELDSVEVSIKGQTSDSRNRSEKKSFSLKTDTYLDQDIMGYDNLNLNCAFEDESGMREVLYYDISRGFTSSLKGSIIDLYINGQSWGPYNNIQQIEGRYIKEWYQDNDGTRWRAVAPDGIRNPTGPFGTGFSTLNYNGTDSTDYNRYYTLKKTTVENPWQSLIDACDKLNNTPLDGIYDELNHYLDIDKSLWFLIQEVVFSDDDSYIWKGGMDYYVYWDITTERIVPMEVDGNSVMNDRNVNWSPFYRENDNRFPLLFRLMKVPEIRQRYLAHLRTVLNDHFTPELVHPKIDQFALLLDQRVKDDPKKIYTYTQFSEELDNLKSWVDERYTFLTQHTEVDHQGVVGTNLSAFPSSGNSMPPLPEEEVIVNYHLEAEVEQVRLYYAQGIESVFERVEMFDDGMHDDQAAGDGIFGARIPGFAANSYVRYYLEVIAKDGFGTATYWPERASYETFIYRVGQAPSNPGSIVINEFMASNDATVQDGEGKYEDWVELYNKGNEALDLTGYFMSDKTDDITKWMFPDGTVVLPGEYLIIWADDDEEDTQIGEIHANFKLSAAGESVLLVNDQLEIVDQVDFGVQETNISSARHPNGIGDFSSGEHTFGLNNDGTTSDENWYGQSIALYPNPSDGRALTLDLSEVQDPVQVVINNALGQSIYRFSEAESGAINKMDVSFLETGVYFMTILNTYGQEKVIKFIIDK